MTDAKNCETSQGRELTGRRVFVWFAGFFALIIGVNAVMVYLAVSTFSGLETDDAYRKGRDYNRVLEAAAKQRALGWKTIVSLQKQESGDAVLVVNFNDAHGYPISDLELAAVMRRPTTDKMDIQVKLSEIKAGEYRGPVELPALGNWLVRIEATNRENETYHLTDRLFVGS